MTRLILPMGLLSMSCARPYGGWCDDIQLGTPLAALPESRPGAIDYVPTTQEYSRPGTMIKGSNCFCASDAGSDAGCGCIFRGIGEPYDRTPCGVDGQLHHCGIYAIDGKVTGVWAYCAN